MEKKQETRKINWESLITELWINILLKLSIRDVVICRSISKFFRSIIDLPYFGFLHFSRHIDAPVPEGGGYDDNYEGVRYQHYCHDPQHDCINVSRTNIIVVERPTNEGVIKGGLYVTKFGDILTPTIKFELLDNWGPLKCDVVGTLNGLLLLHKYESKLQSWNSISELILWNPLTGKTFTIPKSPLCQTGDYLVVNQPVKLAFTYDDDNDDYKIVVVVLTSVPQLPNSSEKPEYRATVEVYSLRSEAWTHKILRVACGLYFGPKINYGGSIIWLAGDLNPNGIGNESNILDDPEGDVNFTHLVYFDLVDEEFYTLKLPISNFDGPGRFLYRRKFLVVYKKQLAVFAIEGKYSEYCVLWALKDDNSWEMQYVCPVDDNLYPSLVCFQVSNTILFVTDCSNDILVSLPGIGLLSYSVEDGSVLKSHPRADFMGAYVQSLLSPSNPFGIEKQQVPDQQV